MTKKYRAAIVGGSGYVGGELTRRLLRHPSVELVRVASIDHVGEPLSAVHPNLEGATALRFEDLSPADAARDVDVVLLGLPPRVSAQKMPEILGSNVRVIDMSGDFRLRDVNAYVRCYGVAHPRPDYLDGRFVYGLPELRRAAIARARAVASPGCFATAVELALYPLARAGLLAGEVDVVGVTGSSGSGVVPSAATHHPVRAGNLRAYRPLEHQHVPEIEDVLGDAGARDVALRFVPVSAPVVRGILVTCFARVPASVDEERLVSLYEETYAREPFVRVTHARLPEVIAVAGSNFVEIGVRASAPRGDTRTITVIAALDNLVKGGAGQAIQSMNVMLGLDETLAIDDRGAYP